MAWCLAVCVHGWCRDLGGNLIKSITDISGAFEGLVLTSLYVTCTGPAALGVCKCGSMTWQCHGATHFDAIAVTRVPRSTRR